MRVRLIVSLIVSVRVSLGKPDNDCMSVKLSLIVCVIVCSSNLASDCVSMSPIPSVHKPAGTPK